MIKRIILPIGIFLFLAGILVGYYFIPRPAMNNAHFTHLQMDEMREEFLSEKEHMTGEMMAHGDYRCCLEKPCVYCIEKTPGHGEGATCSCLEDVVNGKHPCGECIGEILEGHGNRFLVKYFASAIAEEVGEQHLETIKKIISEKYQIASEEQL